MMKHKKHNSLLSDYKNEKRKHLKKLADKMIANADKNDKLKEKRINPDSLNIF